jgi:type IV secretory pathway VirB2 component (pilin)
MNEMNTLRWEVFKSAMGLIASIVSLAGVIIACIKANRGEWSEAAFILGLVVMYRVYDLPSKKRS